MDKKPKNQEAMLAKLGITALNKMQEDAQYKIHALPEVVLLSPTGSGKTLAFLLPLIARCDPSLHEVQAVIITPTRELAIQIEQVAREMGTGLKINVVYGGRKVAKDRIDLAQPPAILIATPGRMVYHLEAESFSTAFIKDLVLDEYDKSLEIGFEKEMEKIVGALSGLKKKILTSATQSEQYPAYVKLSNPEVLNYLDNQKPDLQIFQVLSPSKDKLETLAELLHSLTGKTGIVFSNFKDSIIRISNFLDGSGVDHGVFYGGVEQRERERALIQFRNGTHNLLLATDLAARGLDIQEIDFIIHYHLPVREEEFTHRNGRTARMQSKGNVFVLIGVGQKIPEYLPEYPDYYYGEGKWQMSEWSTVFISGGRQDKISKGDIAGLFFKKGKLKPSELGIIELKSDCAFAAVHKKKINQLISLVNNNHLKKKKVRVYTI